MKITVKVSHQNLKYAKQLNARLQFNYWRLWC